MAWGNVRILCVTNASKQVVLARRVEQAASLWARCRGLLGMKQLLPDAGMYLSPCRSVHTWFMRFPIDALFLDRQGVALYGVTLPPWTLSRWVRRAAGVLELPAGTLQRTGTETGDLIRLDHAHPL